jgi:hypothetical protein
MEPIRHMVTGVKGRDSKVVIFEYSDAYIEEQHRITSLADYTGRNDYSGAAHTVAYDGLTPPHPLTAASIPTRRPCSRTEDVNPPAEAGTRLSIP